jgi:hypothetical protein
MAGSILGDAVFLLPLLFGTGILTAIPGLSPWLAAPDVACAV